MTEEEIKEQAEENYTKVYLNGDASLDTEEKYFAYTKGYCKGHTDGLAEGRKELEKENAKLRTEKQQMQEQVKKILLDENAEIGDIRKLVGMDWYDVKEIEQLKAKLDEYVNIAEDDEFKCDKLQKKIKELEEKIEEMKVELHHRLVSLSPSDSERLDKIVDLDRLWKFGE